MDEEQLYDKAMDAADAVERQGASLDLKDYIAFLETVLSDLQTRLHNAKQDAGS